MALFLPTTISVWREHPWQTGHCSPRRGRVATQTAAAHDDVVHSIEMLTRSADGFAALEAIWEEAPSRLLLADVVSQHDHQQAKTQIGLALPVFERLRSVAEIQRTRALLDRLAL